ncbi:hypothetical protein DOY81_010672 [Sarcophaga bullata]|nr:hypothetical protein DOY81_010672 [Sarcophaga bullata]
MKFFAQTPSQAWESSQPCLHATVTFGNMYRMFVSHYINSANHKAYVEVSEAGSEQPLETGGIKNIFSRTKKFEADHPFVFCIKHKDSVIFMGHIANYAYV